MGRTSQRKGAQGERELAKMLEDEGYRMKRGGPCFGTIPDLVGLPGIHCEVKRVEKLNISAAMSQAARDSEKFQDGAPHCIPPPEPGALACNHEAHRLAQTVQGGEGMTSQKEKALAALLTYPTRKEAAKAAGITDRTLRGYLQDKEFREAYRAAYNDVVEDATRKAQSLMGKAMGVFEDVMDNTEESGATRTQAAAKALEYALRLTEQVDIVAELAELRKAVFPDES